MTVIDTIVHADGTLEYVERELTPQEEEWAIHGEPQPEDGEIPADVALDILTGGVDVDED